MGEKNDVLCSYLKKPEVFADFINGSLFGGREELKPEELAPVTTIVFYHGSGVWDACRDLHGMIDFAGENEFLKSFTANYRMNLVTAADLKEETFRTGLREMIGLLKRSKSKEAIKSYCRENEERFRHMDEETYDLISVMLNHKRLEQYKPVVRIGKGEVDMCQALDEIMEDGIQIGISRGISQGIQQGISRGISQGTLAKAQTAARNMYLRGMKAEDVAAICEEDIEMIKEWFIDWDKGCNSSDRE